MFPTLGSHHQRAVTPPLDCPLGSDHPCWLPLFLQLVSARRLSLGHKLLFLVGPGKRKTFTNFNVFYTRFGKTVVTSVVSRFLSLGTDYLPLTNQTITCQPLWHCNVNLQKKNSKKQDRLDL